LLALLAGEVLSRWVSNQPPSPPTHPGLTVGFAGLAFLCFILAWALKHKPAWCATLATPWKLNTLLCGLALTLPLTLAELSLRPFWDSTRKDAALFIKDPLLGWRLRPHTTAYREAVIAVNAQGHRGPERAIPKPPGTQRILFLGDSIAYGLRLNDNQTYPRKIETLLHSLTGQTVECVNTGVPGYSTWQEYLYYKNEGYRFEPDIVVLSFCMNDVLNTYTGVRFGDYGKDDPIPYIRENWLDSLLQSSALVYTGMQWFTRLRTGANLRDHAIYRESLDVAALHEKANYPEIKEAWQVTQGYIDRIAALAAEQDARFLLVVFPYLFPIPDGQVVAWTSRDLLDYAHQKAYPAINFLAMIQEDIQRTRQSHMSRYFQDSCHPTVYAADLAAQAITAEILKQDWLASP
jgi:lysophospholipase L1-like esterase